PALRLLARPGNPPMVVNTRILVPNFNADMVDGKHASDLSSSCPAGTRSLGGGCIETTVRGTNTLFTASSTCAGIGRRLPTAAELDAFRQQPNVTIGSASSSMEWTGDIEVNQETGALAMSDSGQYSPADRRNSHAFRCVASSS
ncbi:MAG: hypothetical protein ACRDSJ_00730, partial [Rubrobacteraceae bacterium]